MSSYLFCQLSTHSINSSWYGAYKYWSQILWSVFLQFFLFLMIKFISCFMFVNFNIGPSKASYFWILRVMSHFVWFDWYLVGCWNLLPFACLIPCVVWVNGYFLLFLCFVNQFDNIFRLELQSTHIHVEIIDSNAQVTCSCLCLKCVQIYSFIYRLFCLCVFPVINVRHTNLHVTLLHEWIWILIY